MSDNITREWVPVENIVITPDINSIHADTRDFCCLLLQENRKEAIKGQKYTVEESEIKDWLTNLEKMTGGKGKWRMMNFKGLDTGGWFKYIRMYRNDDHSFIVCDREGHSVDPRLMTEDRLNRKYLCFH